MEAGSQERESGCCGLDLKHTSHTQVLNAHSSADGNTFGGCGIFERWRPAGRNT